MFEHSSTNDDCSSEDHDGSAPEPRFSDEQLTRAARLFRALGDAARLRTLELLCGSERCVSEIAAATEEELSTVSHRLRLLQTEQLVKGRRQGRHVMYRLADKHVLALVSNALDHVTHE